MKLFKLPSRLRTIKAITIVLVAIALTSLLLVACDSTANEPANNTTGNNGNTTPAETTVTLRVGAAQVPHAELLEFIKPTLAEQGIILEIIVPSDETVLNQLTDEGEIDVNYYQHKPFLDSVVNEKGFDLVSIGGIHVEPIGAYSTKYTSVSQVPDNAVVAIPNDGTNEYRALRILEQAGFITLKSTIDPVTTTKNDIATYIKPIQIQELESGLIVRTNDEYDLYISNTNRILEAGIDPNTNLFREGPDSPYANIVVVKTARANDPAVLALYNALRTEEVRQFILDKYDGAVVPAF